MFWSVPKELSFSLWWVSGAPPMEPLAGSVGHLRTVVLLQALSPRKWRQLQDLEQSKQAGSLAQGWDKISGYVHGLSVHYRSFSQPYLWLKTRISLESALLMVDLAQNQSHIFLWTRDSLSVMFYISEVFPSISNSWHKSPIPYSACVWGLPYSADVIIAELSGQECIVLTHPGDVRINALSNTELLCELFLHKRTVTKMIYQPED